MLKRETGRTSPLNVNIKGGASEEPGAFGPSSRPWLRLQAEESEEQSGLGAFALNICGSPSALFTLGLFPAVSNFKRMNGLWWTSGVGKQEGIYG